MFGGAKGSDEVADLIASAPYESKSIATVRVDDLPVHLLTWNPLGESDAPNAITGPDGRDVYVGSWLLDDEDFAALLPPDPAIVEFVEGWRPLDLGDVQAIVEAQFGPLGFDTTPQVFPAASVHDDNCPACEGVPLRPVAHLSTLRVEMCDTHRAQADRLMHELDAQVAENSDAWLWWEVASSGFYMLHVPRPLREAIFRCWDSQEPDVGDRDREGQLLLQFLALAGSDDEDLEELFADLEMEWTDFEEWTDDVSYQLTVDQNFELATDVITAIDRVRPTDTANRHAELAYRYVDAGRAEDARREVEIALASQGRDPWTECRVGWVTEILGDPIEARRWYEMAIANARKDPTLGPEYQHDALYHLSELAAEQGWDDIAESASAEFAKIEAQLRGYEYEQPAQREDVAQWGHKVGRNDPCPCGSGIKYKACHGRH